MRKTFLTQEYTKEPIAGTFNMLEQKSFFGSKVLKIDDIITVDENNLIWKESEQHIQGLGLETVNSTVNTFSLKLDNSSIKIYTPQSENDINEHTIWQLDVNIRDIIKKYIFGILKKNRTFALIINENTKYNSVDSAIYEYIEYNIFPRIKFKSVDIYTKYYTLGTIQENVDSSGNNIIAKKYDVQFRDDFITIPQTSNEDYNEYIKRLNVYKESIRVKNFQININNNIATLIFKQTQSSINSKFDYYFNITYIRA